MTVETIKQAIADLSADQKSSLAAWIICEDMDAWDRQIEEDFSPGGPGMALLEEVEADQRNGRLKPMDELLIEVKARRTAKHPL